MSSNKHKRSTSEEIVDQKKDLQVISKKMKMDHSTSLVKSSPSSSLIKTVKRVSDLTAPIMQLSGHSSEVFCCSFSPNSKFIASGSFDSTILLWHASGDCQNYGTIKGHASAILQLDWSRDSSHIYSASADQTVCYWDAESGQRVRKFKGHRSVVNSVSGTRRGLELLSSVGDDGFLYIWDLRDKHPVAVYEDSFPLLSCAFSLDGGVVFVGGVENSIKAIDLRKLDPIYLLQGHTDTVTGLRVSPKGDTLLSNSMDTTLKAWDIKPFAPLGNRFLRNFEGVHHGFENNLIKPCWSPDGDFVASGSANRMVLVWDFQSSQLVYRLPGHKGTVNDVSWTGTVLASASSDKTLFIGELNTDEVK